MSYFICHACSDINSPSGEACYLETPEHIPDCNVLHGEFKCALKYDLLTDFYKIESKEAVDNFYKASHDPLWILHAYGILHLSNEEQLWRKAEEQIQEFRKIQRDARRDIQHRLEAFDLMQKMIVCSQNSVVSMGK